LGYEALCALKPNPKDPRLFNRATRRRIVAMVRRLGPPPIVVNADREVLSGNIWLEAAREAGYDEAPVLVAEHLTPAEADIYLLANAKFALRGEWDPRLLGEVLRDLSVGEIAFDIELTGFEPAEIDLAIEGLDDAAPEAADELPPAGPPVTRPGDLWVLGPHRLLCGSALEAASYQRLMAGDAAAMILTDPPYNVRIAGNVSGLGKVKHGDFTMASGELTEAGFADFNLSWMALAADRCADGALAYVFMDWRHQHELIVAGRRVFDRLVNLCVWTKNNGGMGVLYRSAHELIFVFKKGRGAHQNNVQLGRFGRSRTNVWAYPNIAAERRGMEGDLLALHPTVKPVAMLADALLDVTRRGDLVLDPFVGSGSTIIAADKVGRRARAIELHPPYVDCGIRRWQAWSGEDAVLEGDGRSFTEIAAERTGEGAP
jgi:DNA modification methylase